MDAQIDAPTLEDATRMIRVVGGESLRVTAMRPLRGGMIHHVWLWETDGEPRFVVAKLNTPDHAEGFEREAMMLGWYGEQTRLPVPKPLGLIDGDRFGVSGFVMQHISAPPLTEARLSAQGRSRVEYALGEHIADLHEHRRPLFGPLYEQAGVPRWLDVFEPGITREFHAVRSLLSSRTRETVAHVLRRLDQWLPEQATPTLIHGDLWRSNILVDDAHEDRPRVAAFIDCTGLWADPEYELAYLCLFHTVGEAFFARYVRQHPLRPGFERRCRVYWLNTLLLHVRRFGDRYISTCERVASEIRRMS